MLDNTVKDRMFVYAWEDLDSPNEVKFGEHYVSQKSYEEGIEDTEKYIRSSLGRQKYKFDLGRIKLHMTLDVSKFAETIGKMKKNAKVDDYIREGCLIGRLGRGEFHKLPADDLVRRVYEYLKSKGAPLIDAKLSTGQFEALENVSSAIQSGSKTILAELCARFGKTIWSSAVALESEQELVVIASYVQTVFTSFSNDIHKFNQFRDYAHVDMSKDNYQDLIEEAYSNSKKVFAYLSLNYSSKRQERIDYLFGLNKKRMLIVDEADFGAHQPKQAKLLQDARKDDDKVLIMTGTNSDRAASSWDVDHMVSTSYIELLMHKGETL